MTSRLRLLVVAALLVCAVAGAAVYAMDRHKPASRYVCRTRLPGQARDTLALIGRGGPFPYRTDGVVFDNRERRLPSEPSGYYHEYTVRTPGSADRGARRIVIGQAGEEYWTADHYGTFQRIDTGC
ncbi:ribonuclease [Kitasatospora sp. NBC_01287]|uniref:ribonuclease domain-containing protein n=1 Tax=Kitasatospora sp. NBC_01287 TaxID=2903573 RepID=UPI00225226CB|nr:ribonuclease domain-containing protein [Kitasatospora sp. NBC_01287]MCX4749111.1 ribonuclease [Kitasatospora sp. NBC_01287]